MAEKMMRPPSDEDLAAENWTTANLGVHANNPHPFESGCVGGPGCRPAGDTAPRGSSVIGTLRNPMLKSGGDLNRAADIHERTADCEGDGCTPVPAEPWGHYDPPPAHYEGKGIDPWAVWEAFDLNPWEANVVKYVLRAGKKPGEDRLKDLKKARNYLGYLIEREQGGQS